MINGKNTLYSGNEARLMRMISPILSLKFFSLTKANPGTESIPFSSSFSDIVKIVQPVFGVLGVSEGFVNPNVPLFVAYNVSGVLSRTSQSIIELTVNECLAGASGVVVFSASPG